MKLKPYVITLSIDGAEYSGKGPTAYDALTNLPKPPKSMSKAMLKIEHDGKQKEMLFMPSRIKRLFFTSPSLLQIEAKQLALHIK